jgi:hypothetical protein
MGSMTVRFTRNSTWVLLDASLEVQTMKCLRLGICMLLLNLGLLAGAEKAMGVCDHTKGFSRERAAAALTAAGFTNIQFIELLMPKNPEDVGKVINTNPRPGEKVAPDTLIIVSTYNIELKDPEEPLATSGDDTAWDREAGNAQVSSTTRSQLSSSLPAESSSIPPKSSQVDMAREVAQDATARGPQTEPGVTPEALVGILGAAAGIAGAVQVGGQAGTAGLSPPLTPIPSDVLPGIIPPVGGSGGRAAVPGTGSLPASDPKCVGYSQRIQRLLQEQQRLTQQARAGARKATSEQQRNIVCQLMNNCSQLLETINAARIAGCGFSGNVSPEAISSQLNYYRSLCRGSR